MISNTFINRAFYLDHEPNDMVSHVLVVIVEVKSRDVPICSSEPFVLG